jgi:NitT/TauT family transport system permease protein
MKRLIDRLFSIRTPVGRPATVLLGFLPLILVLGLWFAMTRGDVESRAGSTLLPTPEEVAQEGWKLLSKQDETRNVYKAVFFSMRRVVLGFLVALGVCLPVGVAMGAFSKVDAMLRPISVFGGYLPVAAIVPLTMLFWGTDERQKVYFLAIAGICYLLPLVVKAVQQVDEVFLQTAYTLGATKRHIVAKVLVPIAAGDIYDGMRLAFTVGWTYIMLAEVVAAESGVGFMMEVARRRGKPETVFFMILLIVTIGFVIDKAFGWLGRQLFPHKYAR